MQLTILKTGSKLDTQKMMTTMMMMMIMMMSIHNAQHET